MAYYRRIPDEIINGRYPNEALEFILKDLYNTFVVATVIKKSVRPVLISIQFGRINDDFVNAYTTVLIESKVVRMPRIAKKFIYKRFLR